MKYYIFTIEQINGEEGHSEYAGSSKYNDLKSAEVAYFQKLSNVANDIGINHTYMAIEIRDSFGNTIREDKIGQYVNEETVLILEPELKVVNN